MRRITIVIVLLALTSACSSGQSNLSSQTNLSSQSSSQDVLNELNQGARAFDAKRVAESQRHFEKALALDPANKKAAILLARVIHSQYVRDNKTPGNVAKANEAISAYKKALALDPDSNEGLQNIVSLLQNLDRPDEMRQWVEERASDSRIRSENRSDLYAFLAGKDWECSWNVTDSPPNQKIVEKEGKMVRVYLKPKDGAEYEKAVRCMTVGLQNAENAIKLNENSEKAWSQKYTLLLEAKKLAQMDEKMEKTEDLAKQAEEAMNRSRELFERNKNQSNSTPEQSVETELDTLVPPQTELVLVKPAEEATPKKMQPE